MKSHPLELPLMNNNVQHLPPPKSYPQLGELAGEIRSVIDKHTGELPLASVLGVLEIVKAQLIKENTNV